MIGTGGGGVNVTVVPQLLVKLLGLAAAQVLCAIVTLSAYVLLYRLLAAYAPFHVDPIAYGVCAILVHFGLMTYLQIRRLDD